MNTRDWGRAMRLLEKWEMKPEADSTPADTGPRLQAAIDKFLSDCRRRKLADSTLDAYKKTLEHFAKSLGDMRALTDIDVSAVRDFSTERSQAPGRRGELLSPHTLGKELENVRTFFEFCIDNGWTAGNPARKVKAPRADSLPTMPFSPQEVSKLLRACSEIDNANRGQIPRARLRARALTLFLLYSGLRIGDAVTVRRERLGADRRLLLRMEKTREPLYVQLPNDAVDALHALPRESEYFFWSGQAKRNTAVGSARRTVDLICRLAGIEGGHPHRFRDTFAVELLKKGADLHTLQKLLGHTSIKTTEKHYAPWVTAMQRQLDKATRKLKFG